MPAFDEASILRDYYSDEPKEATMGVIAEELKADFRTPDAARKWLALFQAGEG